MLALGAGLAACGPSPRKGRSASPSFSDTDAGDDHLGDAAPSHLGIRLGNAEDAVVTPDGPAVLLLGGGAYPWRAAQELAAVARGGDVIYLTTQSRSLDEWEALGLPASWAFDAWLCDDQDGGPCASGFNSVQTIRLPTHAPTRPCPHTTAHWTDADWEAFTQALAALDAAEVVIFGGGSQHSYVDWPEELHRAVWGVYQRGGVLAGGSAGMALLAGHVYDARAADDLGIDQVSSAAAVVDPGPQAAPLSFSTVYPLGFLEDVVTDTHFIERDRFGRTTVFLAHLGDGVRAIACDANNSLMVSRNGLAEFIPGDARGACFIITPTTPFGTDLPFAARCLRVTRLDKEGQGFDLLEWTPLSGSSYSVNVDAALSPFYQPADPYWAAADAGAPGCD
jgi:cyanophycinase-like exopeptidase